MKPSERERYIVLRSFLSQQEQEDVTEETLHCHVKNSTNLPSNKKPNMRSDTSCSFEPVYPTTSFPLNLGIRCGASVETQLPIGSIFARRAFARASASFPQESSLSRLSSCSQQLRLPLLQSHLQSPLQWQLQSPQSSSLVLNHNENNNDNDNQQNHLTGLALLYGPDAAMSPHFDSPTQPGQRNEWLAMITLGNPVHFICNHNVITLLSGDALVMDSMAVLHGVKGIGKSAHTAIGIPGHAREKTSARTIDLPISGSRLGILFWQARQQTNTKDLTNDHVDGSDLLYQQDDEEDYDDDKEDNEKTY